MVGCLSFDVNEYFKRYLATNATVRMITRLLSYHTTNDVSVNHYAFCYLQRLCSFRLQQDFPAPPRPVRGYNDQRDTSPAPLSATSSLGGILAPVGEQFLCVLKSILEISPAPLYLFDSSYPPLPEYTPFSQSFTDNLFFQSTCSHRT